MNLTREEYLKKRTERTAFLATAFDHPVRMSIIHYLLDHPTCVCEDLSEVLPFSKATINGHLKKLKNIGIIKGEVTGKQVNYCINEKVWEETKFIFIDLFSRIINKSKC